MKIESSENLCGRFNVEGDKSITIRALLLSCLIGGRTKIYNPLISEDTISTINCIRALGAKVRRSKGCLTISGSQLFCDRSCADKISNERNFAEKSIILDCKNSGTTARLLIGMLSGAGINATITGDENLKSRPMDRVINPLSARGAKIVSNGGKLPVTIYPAKLKPFEFDMPVDSAQVKSAILLSGLVSGEKTVITERNFTRNHTEEMLGYLGAAIKVEDKKITLEKSRLKVGDIFVPNDFSSACYYLALGLLLGEVTVPKVPIIDTRAGFLKILSDVGGKFSIKKIIKKEPINYAEKNCKHCKECENVQGKDECSYLCDEYEITAYKSDIKYFEIHAKDLANAIDELPLIAAVAAKNNGCKIFGAGELRIKESDRLSGIEALIEKAGGKCDISGDDIVVYPTFTAKKFTYSSDDHRMAMTAFVLMKSGLGGELENGDIVNISFPRFFDNFSNMQLALIGENVKKSLSGKIHKFILSKIYGGSFSYECISLPHEKLSDFINKSGYKSVNVTFPYKKEVLSLIKNQSEMVLKCKASNFLKNLSCQNSGKKIIGAGKDNVGLQSENNYACYNTDGDGLLRFLISEKVALKGKNVLIAGGGGAAASIAFALNDYGARVYLRNRTKKKAEEISLLSGGKINVYDENSDNLTFDILINATTLKEENPFFESEIKNCRLGIDINYGNETKMLKELKIHGKIAFDGLGMLFYQAYLSDCILLNYKNYKGKYGSDSEVRAFYDEFLNISSD